MAHRRPALLFVTVLIGCALGAPSAFAAPTVYFAGFALRGAADSAAQRFPYTYPLATSAAGARAPLDVALANQLKRSPPRNFQLDMTSLGDVSAGQSIALALVLNRETVGQEKIGNIYKVYIQLEASALFFDFRGMRVIAAYPVGLEYIDAFNATPTADQITSDIKRLYLGNSPPNLLEDFVTTLSQVTPRLKSGNSVRVTSVTIDPSVMKEMAPALRASPDDAREFVAETFGTVLAENQHVSVLPYAKDSTIGNTMALRFANGDVYNLAIPKTDYAFAINLTGTKKVAFDKKSFATSWIYGVFAKLKLYEPLSGHVYLEAPFREAVTKVVPSNQTTVMEWPIYQEAIRDLFNHVTQALSNPTSRWAKASSGDAHIGSQLKQTEEVIASCR